MENENNLIAEFMGVKIGVDNYSWRPGCIDKITENNLGYHKSWSWLMPVIEKISQIKFDDGETIYPHTFGMINKENGNFMFRFNRHHLFENEKLIAAAFNAVVDYIQNANR